MQIKNQKEEKMRKHFAMFALVAVMIASAILGDTTTTQAAAATTVKPHPEVKMSIYTTSFGTTAYIASFALADIVNKKHPWLRIGVVETTQGADAVKSVALAPELRKTSMFNMSSTLHYEAVQGKGAFTSPVNYQVISVRDSNAVSFVTLDPNIKTMKDLNGKRVSAGVMGGPGPTYLKLLELYGVKPAIIEKLSWAPAKDALMDGKVDACLQTLGDTTLTPYMPPALIHELQTKKGFHVIPFDLEMLKKVADTNLVGYVELPAGMFGAPNPVITSTNLSYWGACPEFDAEIAYEVAKSIAENAEAFQGYDKSLAAIRRSAMAAVPIPPLTLHPSAEKYYKEVGIKIGQSLK
jgi:TRAP transporter TAXI family solute receptor